MSNFITGSNQWDLQQLTNSVCEEDLKTIVQIPLGGSEVWDELVWHYDRKGTYSVNSGYRLAVSFNLDSGSPSTNHCGA